MGMTNNRGPRLHRCPFCGGSARVLYGGLVCMATVECTKCGANVKAIEEYREPVGIAIEKWNRRTDGNGDKRKKAKVVK